MKWGLLILSPDPPPRADILQHYNSFLDYNLLYYPSGVELHLAPPPLVSRGGGDIRLIPIGVCCLLIIIRAQYINTDGPYPPSLKNGGDLS